MKYNIHEKAEKSASYRMNVSGEVIDSLYEHIIHKMIVEKKYKDPTYNATVLAAEIGTNTRYISAVVSLRFQTNFSQLVNAYRVREAIGMLTDRRNTGMTMEEIAIACGFTNRQTFYAAFYRMQQTSPKEYQTAFFEKINKK